VLGVIVSAFKEEKTVEVVVRRLLDLRDE